MYLNLCRKNPIDKNTEVQMETIIIALFNDPQLSDNLQSLVFLDTDQQSLTEEIASLPDPKVIIIDPKKFDPESAPIIEILRSISVVSGGVEVESVLGQIAKLAYQAGQAAEQTS
jgi:hypothetical protein